MYSDTYSSIFSFLIPSQSFIRFCLTPLWLSHLPEEENINTLLQSTRMGFLSEQAEAQTQDSLYAAQGH